MKILLDTHVVIWALTDDGRLTKAVRERILSPDNIVFFSVVSLWEIAIKNQKAPEKCPYHESEIFEYCKGAGFEIIPVLPEHITGLRGLQEKKDRNLSNNDPFDRLILSQAKIENCIMLSHDTNFKNYDEKCICII